MGQGCRTTFSSTTVAMQEAYYNTNTNGVSPALIRLQIQRSTPIHGLCVRKKRKGKSSLPQGLRSSALAPQKIFIPLSSQYHPIVSTTTTPTVHSLAYSFTCTNNISHCNRTDYSHVFLQLPTSLSRHTRDHVSAQHVVQAHISLILIYSTINKPVSSRGAPQQQQTGQG